MSVSTCIQCGEVIPETAKRCPVCGAPVACPSPAGQDGDPRAQHVRQLLLQAKQCQHEGDLPMAIRHAREALSLNCDECAIHALLGHLYEQAGDHAVARQHFHLALHMTPTSASPTPMATLEQETSFSHQARGSWILLVLIGCVLFSGVAMLFVLFPNERDIGHGTIFQAHAGQARQAGDPRWTWIVPTPVKEAMPQAPPVAPPLATETPEHKTVLAVDRHVEAAPAVTPPAQEALPEPPQVLGPSASAGIPAEATEPTVEQADQAYFHGKYERAVSIYEALIRRQDKPDPRLFQNLAWCYQQLGNSQKAAEHLEKAVLGYQIQLANDPQNLAVQQEQKSCEAALRSLQVTRDIPAAP